jgi:5-formyltetrahydrofolate cyclo-ligase
MSESLVTDRKRTLRASAVLKRSSLKATDTETWSGIIQVKVLQSPPYLRSQSVALYSPIQNEVDTAAIRDHALATGKRVYYPRLAEGSSLELVQVDRHRSFVMGRFGILEPVGDAEAFDDQEGLLVIVPALVFDHQGNRLGRGLGFYDRLLKGLSAEAVFMGLSYEFQLVDEVPAELWDQRVHYIITERRMIDCASSQSNLEV